MFQVFVPTLLFWPGEGEVKAKFPMVFVSTLSTASQLLTALTFLSIDLPNSKSALQSVPPSNITTQSNT
jgi:hypothetical protein